MVTTATAVAFSTMLAILALFQLLLIIGLPFGRYAWGGQNPVLPIRHRVGSAVSIVVYAIFSVLALNRAALTSILPRQASVIAMWVIATYLALSVLPNLASRSRPEKLVMTPVSLVLTGLAMLLTMS
ncbi:hypothetical protein ACW0JT_19345 [Arthrobacter sp. SA17]